MVNLHKSYLQNGDGIVTIDSVTSIHPMYTLQLQCVTITVIIFCSSIVFSWWRGTVVERRSLTGELSLSCARPAADG